MKKSPSAGHRRAAALAGLLLWCLAAAVLAAADPAAPATPAMPVTPPAPSIQSQAQIDKQLQAAQRQLEHAANEVARLSTQLSDSMLNEVMPLVEPRAVIGVQLENAPDGVGARVREVSPGGPAAEAGLRVEDVIVAVNGTQLKPGDPPRQVSGILHGVKPDAHVSVRVLRQGKPLDLEVTPRGGPGFFGAGRGMDFDFELPELPEVFVNRPLRDMELVTLTPRLGSYFGTDKGVLVVRAPTDGTFKLEDGDVIVAIDGREPTSGSHATRILRSYQAGEKVTLRIIRQHKTFDIATTLPERATRHATLHSATRGGVPGRHAALGNDEAPSAPV